MGDETILKLYRENLKITISVTKLGKNLVKLTFRELLNIAKHLLYYQTELFYLYIVQLNK